jgi:hypothetical protein
MTAASASELAGVLAVNKTLQSLCVGDSAFGDKVCQLVMGNGNQQESVVVV